MGIFDVFKKKKNDAPAENELEIALRKAATEPAYRADFYKKLLSEKLVVITEKSVGPPGEKVLQKDTTVNISSFKDGKIPVFTSSQRIFDKGVIKEEVNFMEVKGEDLFNFTKGAGFILNPYSDYGKELLPDEIESLIAGTIFDDVVRQRVIEKDTQVLIGQPAVYPTEMINSLKLVFAQFPNVNAAYLGWIQFPDAAEQPHYIIGLDTSGDTRILSEKAGFTAKTFLKENEFVDVIKIEKGVGLSDYFLDSTEPFYKK